MSYTPTDWKTGDVITADKLNNIEQGIVNAGNVEVFEFEVITDNDNQVVTDVTVQDVIDAYSAGKACIARIGTRGAAQPAETASKSDLVFTCGVAYGIAQADKSIILETVIPSTSTEAIAINVMSLLGNRSGWTYSGKSMYAQIASEQ